MSRAADRVPPPHITRAPAAASARSFHQSDRPALGMSAARHTAAVIAPMTSRNSGLLHLPTPIGCGPAGVSCKFPERDERNTRDRDRARRAAKQDAKHVQTSATHRMPREKRQVSDEPERRDQRPRCHADTLFKPHPARLAVSWSARRPAPHKATTDSRRTRSVPVPGVADRDQALAMRPPRYPYTRRGDPVAPHRKVGPGQPIRP